MNTIKQYWYVVIAIVLVLAVTAVIVLQQKSDNNDSKTDAMAGPTHLAGPFKVQVTVKPDPPRVGQNTVEIVLRNKDQQPVTDAKISAAAVMPAMGSMQEMRAAATITHKGGGRYVGTFEPSMKGSWPLSLEIESKTQGNARLTLDLATGRKGLMLSTATPSTIARTESTSTTVMSINTHMAGPFKVQVTVNPDPPQVGENTVKIRILDKDNKAVTDAKISAAAVMPAMGSMPEMRAAATVKHEGKGRYTGTFEPSMKGSWPLSLEIDSPTIGNAKLTLDLATGRKGLMLSSASPSTISTSKTTQTGTIPGAGVIIVDARRRQSIGVTLGKVQRQDLELIIRAAGKVSYDETRLTDISLKYKGWIGKLHAGFVGARVRKGRPLFTVYSPELLSAQEEFIQVMRRGRNKSLMAAARRRLALWDIRPGQMRVLLKRGRAYEQLPILSPVNGTVIDKKIVAGTAVQPGQTLLRLADLSQVWVEAQVYEYELPHVRVGMPVEVLLPDVSSKPIPARIAYIDPFLQGDSRTARIRVILKNPKGMLRPDMYAHVHIKANLGKRLVIPESAVLYAGDRRIVFVDLGGGRLQPRRVKTGVRTRNWIEIIDGVRENETVVTSGNFLIAAETKLKSGLDQW